MAEIMTPTPPLSAQWLAHRFDPIHDAFQFVSVDRAHRQSVPFLTDEHIGSAAEPLVITRSNVSGLIDMHRPLHYIFHSAYCCSTLLVNALDQSGSASGLKEPVVLNDLVGWRHRGGDPTKIADVLTTTLGLLARPFEGTEAVIVKPSNAVNGLAAAMMTLRPNAHAILLYAPLRTFLTSIARKGMWGRLWVRELLSLQLKDGLVDLGFSPPDYLRHTDLQAAAVGWLAQQKLFSQLAARWPSRVMTLCSEELTASPVTAVGACATFFGLATNPESYPNNIEQAFNRDAKDGTVFLPGQRERTQQNGEALHADEIDKVMVWAEAVAATADVPLSLSNRLLRTRAV
tara:strand:- start:279 stop:1313 length:1035 start_codon:yes stop_codon:yes gene_type:complete